jgi:hypothetical protein
MVWQTSTDNGDKPGIGIRLIGYEGQISGTFFLLDPDKPHDFSKGRAFPTQVVHTTQFDFRFLVRLNETQKDEFVITLEGPLKGRRVKATLRDLDGKGSPIALTFVRQN